MKKILIAILTSLIVALFILIFLLMKDKQEIIYVDNLTLISITESEELEPFIELEFQTEEGDTVYYSAHQVYLKLLKEGKTYSFGYREDYWFRPDNELMDLE